MAWAFDRGPRQEAIGANGRGLGAPGQRVMGAVTALAPNAKARSQGEGQHHCRFSLSKALKPACSKSPVVSERVGHVPLLHDKKARAVREAPGLITSSGVVLYSSPKLAVCLRDDLNVRPGFQFSDHLRGKASKPLASACQVVERLGQRHLRGYDCYRSQTRSHRRRPFVQLVTGIQESNQ